MNVNGAVKIYLDYLKSNSAVNTVRSFKFTLIKFSNQFVNYKMDEVKDSDIISFVTEIAGERSQSTKNSRVSVIRSFYNFIIDVTEADYPNPCQKPMIKKLYKNKKFSSPKLLDKDLIDEIIFRTTNERNRLILELMGRSGMRIGEVLNIHIEDIDFEDSTILITNPKSGRSGEKVYITKKLCGKLQLYSSTNNLKNKLFELSYTTAYRMVKNAGKVVGSLLRPHDLRRHAATQASRSGVPLEIVSKVILRHANISTTQRYLGSIDHEEASRWIEHLNR